MGAGRAGKQPAHTMVNEHDATKLMDQGVGWPPRASLGGRLAPPARGSLAARRVYLILSTRLHRWCLRCLRVMHILRADKLRGILIAVRT